MQGNIREQQETLGKSMFWQAYLEKSLFFQKFKHITT